MMARDIVFQHFVPDGISPQRASQIVKAALDKLHKALAV
jgi:hypothetical protein